MEKVPRKKAKKGIGGKKLLLLLIGCALLAGGGVYLLRRPAALPPITDGEQPVMLLNRSEEEISAVAIAPRDGTPYPLVRQGDGFALLGREDAALRDAALEELIMSVGQLPAETVVAQALTPETGLTAAVFGLDPARARVTVTYMDGEQKELLVGEVAPNEDTPQRYCMLTGDPRLFTILESDAAPFLREAAYWTGFDQPRLNGSLLDRIEISGEKEFSARYTPSGWQMEAPFSYPLSASKMDTLLSKIESMAFDSYLGEETDALLNAYGLASPALTVRLVQAATVITGETAEGEQVTLPVAEKEYTLRLSGNTGTSEIFALWQGGVYRASTFLLGFFGEVEPRDMALLRPVNFLVNDLSAVTFALNGKTSRYEVRMVESVTENNQIAVDEYGRTLYDCAVRRAGESRDMDAEAFLNWYTELAALSGDGQLPRDYAPTGEPLAQIILENDHLTRTVSFYPFDALHDAFSVDGTALYYVRRDWLESVSSTP